MVERIFTQPNHIEKHIERVKNKVEGKPYDKIRLYLNQLDKDVNGYKENIELYIGKIEDADAKASFQKGIMTLKPRVRIIEMGLG